MKYTHDAIVIGAGAAGLTVAGGCAMFGLKVALIEAGAMGGECLNTGCVPSKALLAAARRAAEARRPARLGVMLDLPQVDWGGVRAHVKQAIAAIEPHDSQARFEDLGCEVIRHRARFTGPRSVEAGGRMLSAPRIVIATGSEVNLPALSGLSDIPYLTHEDVFDLDELPRELIVLGGGAMGLEMAQAFCRLGSKVTVMESSGMLVRDDRDAVDLLVERMQAEGVQFVHCGGRRVTGGPGAIEVICDDDKSVTGSHLLLATGKRARTAGLGLEEIGVRLGTGGIAVDDRRRTSLKHIYAIGDCREGPRLTHVAGYEGSNVVLEIALGLPARVDWRALLWCTYTDPEIAQVGLTEEQARAAYGAKLKVVTERFADNDRALAEGESAGFAKVMFNGRRMVGASICGAHAGEMLLPFAQAIIGKASSFSLGSAIVAYPTLSEIAKATAFAAWEPIVFGPLAKRYATFRARMRR